MKKKHEEREFNGNKGLKFSIYCIVLYTLHTDLFSSNTKETAYQGMTSTTKPDWVIDCLQLYILLLSSVFMSSKGCFPRKFLSVKRNPFDFVSYYGTWSLRKGYTPLLVKSSAKDLPRPTCEIAMQ